MTSDHEINFGQQKIMIADDEEGLLEILGEAFESAHAHVFLARDCAQALTVAKQEDPAICLLDFFLSGDTILDFLSKLESPADSRKASIMLFTGNFWVDVEKLYYLGVDVVFFKPMNITKMMETIKGYLDGRNGLSLRQHERPRTYLPVRVKNLKTEEVLNATVLNLSSGGVFCACCPIPTELTHPIPQC